MDQDKQENADSLRVMITTDRPWVVCRFEFDAGDGRGIAWHQECSLGPNESVENCIRHFTEEGYTVVAWQKSSV